MKGLATEKYAGKVRIGSSWLRTYVIKAVKSSIAKIRCATTDQAMTYHPPER
jgi:hypothetical protein